MPVRASPHHPWYEIVDAPPAVGWSVIDDVVTIDVLPQGILGPRAAFKIAISSATWNDRGSNTRNWSKE